jgi:hypothetical protein
VYYSDLNLKMEVTRQNGGREITIDLVLATEELATLVVKCTIHMIEYGPDHRAIETAFDVTRTESRSLFKDAPWKDIMLRCATWDQL